MPEVIRLPIITIQGNQYFVDSRLKQIRNVSNPHEHIPFDEAFVKVRLRTEHLVLNCPYAIQKARETIVRDIKDAVEIEKVWNMIDTEPPTTQEVEDHMDDLLNELEDHNATE